MKTWQRLGETIREIGILVFVFAPLDVFWNRTCGLHFACQDSGFASKAAGLPPQALRGSSAPSLAIWVPY